MFKSRAELRVSLVEQEGCYQQQRLEVTDRKPERETEREREGMERERT